MRSRLRTTLFYLFLISGSGAFAQAGIKAADVVGTWQSTGLYIDTNRNGKLDEGERNTPMPGWSDYLHLGADGQAVFYVHKVNGRYELQPRSDGSSKLILFDRDNNKEDRGLVYSANKNELVLFNFSTRAFGVYQRR
jgi:hypothetical protein